jgi:hypothetical protein
MTLTLDQRSPRVPVFQALHPVYPPCIVGRKGPGFKPYNLIRHQTRQDSTPVRSDSAGPAFGAAGSQGPDVQAGSTSWTPMVQEAGQRSQPRPLFPKQKKPLGSPTSTAWRQLLDLHPNSTPGPRATPSRPSSGGYPRLKHPSSQHQFLPGPCQPSTTHGPSHQWEPGPTIVPA